MLMMRLQSRVIFYSMKGSAGGEGLKQSRLKKTQVRRSSLEPTQKKEYNLTLHNKLKVDYRNKDYRKAYEQLRRVEKVDPACLPLYLEDLVCAVGKVMREVVLNRQPPSSAVENCVAKGKGAVRGLYKQLVAPAAVTYEDVAVNKDNEARISRFLNSLLSYLSRLACLEEWHGDRPQASQVARLMVLLCEQILSSATSNYKLLKRVSECLLTLAAQLIDRDQVGRATEMLFRCLQNEVNLLVLLSHRLKYVSRQQARRRKLDLFNRLYAIFLNLALCFELKGRPQCCYPCLLECQAISRLKKHLLMSKEMPLNWTELLRPERKIHMEYQELNKIAAAYFEMEELAGLALRQESRALSRVEEVEEAVTVQNLAVTMQRTRKILGSKRKIGRSVSLPEQGEPREGSTSLTHELLFFGTGVREGHNGSKIAQRFRGSNEAQGESKLRKKGKGPVNNIFRTVKQPVEYESLQQNWGKMWQQEAQNSNQTREKLCLLRYKRQQVGYQGLAQQSKENHPGIRVVAEKEEPSLVVSRPQVEHAYEHEQETGVNLLKKILLKHAHKLDLKRPETLGVLRWRRVTKVVVQSCTSAQRSVGYLLDRLKREKARINGVKGKGEDSRQQYKPKGDSNLFLTKDTVEIPNLFLSYITYKGRKNVGAPAVEKRPKLAKTPSVSSFKSVGGGDSYTDMVA